MAQQLVVLGPQMRTKVEIAAKPRPEWRRVECPSCGKFICKAMPGSTVHVVCSRCKTESITAIAA